MSTEGEDRSADLGAALLRCLDGDRAAAVAAVPALATVLADGLAAGRAAWPALAVSAERFVAQVAVAVTGPEDAALLPRLHLADLYAIAACVDGDRAAIDQVVARYRTDLRAGLAELRLGASQIDDVVQDLWHTLLVGPSDGRPRIGDYRGRGELRRWLRASALRAAYKVLERAGRDVELDDEKLAAIPDGGRDVELEYLRQRYTATFKEAVQAAIASLDVKQRALLRRHHLDGLTIDDLAALHRVHRATAARWIADAREAVWQATRRGLHERLKLGEGELTSLLAALTSQLDVSLERALATGGG